MADGRHDRRRDGDRSADRSAGAGRGRAAGAGRDDRPGRDRAGSSGGRSPSDARGPRPAEGPPIPAHVTGAELDARVVREIAESLGDSAEEVCRRLAAAGLALDDGDMTLAAAHAEVARRMGSRLAVVREATGVVAYQAGDYERALRDLQAARRIGGSVSALAVMADCERALGRPQRALDLAATADPGDMDVAEVVELLIVTAGARLDLGQPDAAVATLRTRHLEVGSSDEWQERMWFAYAEALAAAGRKDEALTWMRRAAAHPAGVTDARRRAGLPVSSSGKADGRVAAPDDDGGDAVGGFIDLDEVTSSPMLRKRPEEDSRRQLRPERGRLDRHQQTRRDGVEDIGP